jgi:hypothetical protein
MEVDQAKDPKSMSLDALIKIDKTKNKAKGGKGKPERPSSARAGLGGKKGPQGGRPRFENIKGRSGAGKGDVFKAKKTGNMISKANERTVQFKKKQFNKDQARSGKGVSESPRRNLKVSSILFVCIFFNQSFR